jgi:hypothetical protein
MLAGDRRARKVVVSNDNTTSTSGGSVDGLCLQGGQAIRSRTDCNAEPRNSMYYEV